MQLFTRFFPKLKLYPLSYRLLLYVVLCSSLLALLATTIQLFMDFHRDVDAIYISFGVIQKNYLNYLRSAGRNSSARQSLFPLVCYRKAAS